MELPEFRQLAPPSVGTIEGEIMIDVQEREIEPIGPGYHGDIPSLVRGEVRRSADLGLLMKGDLVEQLEIHREAHLLQHLPNHGGLDREILGGEQADRQARRITGVVQELTRLARIKGIRGEVGIIPKSLA